MRQRAKLDESRKRPDRMGLHTVFLLPGFSFTKIQRVFQTR
jgi:hypothetical protein